MALRKTEKADLRRTYPLFVEIGMVLSLAILIIAFRLDMRVDDDFNILLQEQEIVQMEDIQQTQQIEKPPPPPRPPVPVEVPNDEILEDDEIDFDAFLDIDEIINLPPPPPPAVVEELEPEIFVIVEQMPCLLDNKGWCDPSNMAGLIDLQKRIRYPEIAKKAGVEGRVFLQFVVNENGDVVDPVVTRGIGAGCDEEAVRGILTAKFTPGKQRGKTVKVKMSLPITFKLK